MLILVTYDVSTVDKEGARRLQKVAKTCLNYGQRVQNSVFECLVDNEHWLKLRQELVGLIDPDVDSLRFYFLGKNWKHRVEHIGAKSSLDLEGPLVL